MTLDAGTAGLTASANDVLGRLVRTVEGTGLLAVPVEPFGFTYVTGD